MGPDLELKEKPSGTTEAFSTKGNGSVQREPRDHHLNQCATNFDNRISQIEASRDGRELEVVAGSDMEVNIFDLKDSGADDVLEDIYDDATESMSSFGNTVSESDDGSVLSDTEVESKFYVDEAPTSIFNGFAGGFGTRKRKLTDHWRRFIHPLMWRCKWVELQINEYQSQARKYDRELTEQEQRKLADYKQILVEGSQTRSLPVSGSIQRKSVMRRNKRKRLEETTDVATYTRQHNLISYFETKKSTTNEARASVFHNRLNLDKKGKGNDESSYQDRWASLELREGDIFFENVLRNIDSLQLQVRKVMGRIDKFISDNPVKFNSLNVLSLGAYGEENVASRSENEPRVSVEAPNILSLPASKYRMGEFMPQSAIRNHGKEGILIDNQAAQEELQNFRSLGTLLDVKHEETTESHLLTVDSLDLPEARVHFAGKSLPKSRTKPSTKKRKGAKRKPRVVRR